MAEKTKRYFVFACETSFNFEAIQQLFGEPFCSRLMAAWKQVYQFKSTPTAKQNFYSLRRFLIWVGDNADASEDVARLFQFWKQDDVKAVDYDTLFNSVDFFASKIRDISCSEVMSSTKPQSRRSVLEGLSTSLRNLAATGLWHKIPAIKNLDKSHFTRGTTQSFGELVRPGEKLFPENTKADEQIGVVYQNSKDRLAALRKVVVSKLLEAKRLFDLGQSLLKLQLPWTLDQFELLPINELQKIYDERGCHPLPTQFGNSKVVLASLLQWLVEKNSGLVHCRSLPHRFKRIVWRNGGAAEITKYLEGTEEALFSAHTIVMIDTGLNVQTCDDLHAEPFVGKQTRGKIQIETVSARKRRSKGKLVEAALPNQQMMLIADSKNLTLSAAEAIRMWQAMSVRLRERTETPEIEEKLWIVPRGQNNQGPIEPYSFEVLTRWWNKMLEENQQHPVIGELDLRRRQIRTTFLQIADYENHFSFGVAQALANHGSASTTYRYLSSKWMKNRETQLIRDFQNLFEAALVEDTEIIASKLQLSSIELLDRKSLAAETGLGFVCELRTSHQSISQHGCDELDQCSTCQYRRFVPTSDSLTALVLTNISLSNQASEYSSKNPERWSEIWLPYLALTFAVISRLKRSRYRAKLAKTEKFVTAKLDKGELAELRLW